ncbi:MAG TPA: CsbD family protein [Conexibacter sp.]|nr:CsbD family protein [Conexibacter sp.]
MSDGSLDTAKGRVKQATGNLTGDDDLKREGKVDEASGTLKEKIGDAADKVKDALHRNRDND